MIDVMAIGGGQFEENVAIDQEFRARAKGRRTLFLPTATQDSEDYVEKFTYAYAALGCEVGTLRLSDPEPQAKLNWADLIYVGGGNTKWMLEQWRMRGIDTELKECVRRGIPVGGLSAGAICWFRVGNSDWPQYEGIPGVNTARLDALGLIDLVFCPHTKEEAFRLGEFREMMKTESGVGVGVDDRAAIHVLGDRYRVIASSPDSAAVRLEWKAGECQEDKLPADGIWRALSDLVGDG